MIFGGVHFEPIHIYGNQCEVSFQIQTYSYANFEHFYQGNNSQISSFMSKICNNLFCCTNNPKGQKMSLKVINNKLQSSLEMELLC